MDLQAAMPVRVHVHVTQLLSDGICVCLGFFSPFFFIKNLGNCSLSPSWTDTLLKEP